MKHVFAVKFLVSEIKKGTLAVKQGKKDEAPARVRFLLSPQEQADLPECYRALPYYVTLRFMSPTPR